MLLFIMLAVATIMTVFGVIGFLRVTKASVIILAVLLSGPVFLRAAGPQLIAIINRLGGFFLGGGVNALTGGDASKGLSDALSKPAKALIDPGSPAAFYLLMFYFIMIVGLLLGSLKPFKLSGRYSFSGLLLGLVNGYTVAAYSIAVIFPEFAVLPVPLEIKGMTPQIPPPGIPVASSDIVWTKLMQFLGNLSGNPSAPYIIAGLIVIFIFMAARLSAKKG
ncbi:MAG: hypothetical protein QG637_237 [Chloroflexota bacterium]|nr:hypothetical protein [Chloroflexota bacterium]